MSRALADLVPGRAGGVAILAEYPYYRADRSAWKSNLLALRELGTAVVTAYVPWRLHELDPDIDGESGHDFTGRTDPRRDVLGFVMEAAAAGLWVILKPGPFIHAEVRLGGLPERLTRLTPRRSLAGQVITDEGAPTPSAHSEEFTAAAVGWLRTVREHVVDVVAYPRGPVIAVQVGNEGVFSDLHRSIAVDDFSPPALAAHARWPGGRSSVPTDATSRERWVRWSGMATRSVLTGFKNALGDALPTVVNLPLPSHPGPERGPETWLVRAASAPPTDTIVGNTSWSGNATFSDEALAALWLGMRFARTDVVEDNWGFTWTDDTYPLPAVPLCHALLGLAFGSSTVSVYTACTTYHWPAHLSPDEAGVLQEGGKPEDFAPPYCPGAPLDESGAQRPNAGALRLLSGFADWFGAVLRSAGATAEVALVVDPVAVASSAWPVPAPERAALSVATAAALRLMLYDGVEVDIVRPDDPRLVDHPWRTLLVVGGSAMGRETQRSLAEIAVDRRTVVVGAIPERDEVDEPCETLARTAVEGHLEQISLPGTDGAVDLVHAALGGVPSQKGPRTLVLVRTDPATETSVIYLFNRTDLQKSHRGLHAGVEVAVSLAPRGVAVLIIANGTLRGFLLNRGVLASEDSFTPVLQVAGTSVPLPQAGDVIGRLNGAAWEFRGA